MHIFICIEYLCPALVPTKYRYRFYRLYSLETFHYYFMRLPHTTLEVIRVSFHLLIQMQDNVRLREKIRQLLRTKIFILILLLPAEEGICTYPMYTSHMHTDIVPTVTMSNLKSIFSIFASNVNQFANLLLFSFSSGFAREYWRCVAER